MMRLSRLSLIILVLITIVMSSCGQSLITSSPTTVTSPAATNTPEPPASSPSTQNTNSTVIITYASVFTPQADSTNRLLIDMTIENKGYEVFNTSPENFSLMISNAELGYDTAQSDLKTVNLLNGEILSGKLAFQVPPETTEADCQLVYTGAQVYNIWWTKSATAANPDTTNKPAPNPMIVIKYSPAFVIQNSGYYLVVNVSIENRGYPIFNTSPENFSVSVSNAKFYHDPETSDLKTFDMPNGGKVNGKLAFKVPTGTGKVGFKLNYSGARVYNIFWTEIKRN